MESLLTQFVFSHSLRVRVKAESSEENAKAGPDGAAQKGKPKAGFAGKVNNLMTSDLSSITSARDFLLVCEYAIGYGRLFR